MRDNEKNTQKRIHFFKNVPTERLSQWLMFREYDLFSFLVEYFHGKRETLKTQAFTREYNEDTDVYKLLKDQAESFAYGEFEHVFELMQREKNIRDEEAKKEHEKRKGKDIIPLGGNFNDRR